MNDGWTDGCDVGTALGRNDGSAVGIELGCGDGAFANMVLSKHFGTIDGYDLSKAGIDRANKLLAKPNMSFTACDITAMDYTALPKYDGAFLYGILHHVKSQTPDILRKLRGVTPRIIILEPNGNHLLRKALEKTELYKAAGEDSFRTSQMEAIFAEAGYKKAIWKRLNIFPNFTPKLVFDCLKPLEPVIEKTPGLRALCTVNMWGFVAE